MHIVYRVENEAKEGPYVDMHTTWWLEDHNDSNHPTPKEDGLLELSRGAGHSDWFCGFKSLHDLLRWFSVKELENLYEDGFRIVTLHAEEIMEGSRQVIFKGRNDA